MAGMMSTNKLSSNNFTELYNLLIDKKVVEQNFETISLLIQKEFDKTEYVNVGTFLSILVRQGDFPGIIQRLIAYYLIWDLFRCDGQAECPFMPFLLSAIDAKEQNPTKMAMIERMFLAQLVNGAAGKELGKQTAAGILQMDYSAFPDIDVSNVRAECLAKQNELPMTVKASLPNVLPSGSNGHDTGAVKDMIEGLCDDYNSPLSNVFAPQFFTIAPPLLTCEDELIWFDLTNSSWHKPAYDSSAKIEPSKAKDLWEQAYTQSLSIHDQGVLLNELNNTDTVNKIGITPESLPGLVENNPLIAIEVLLKLLQTDKIHDYYRALISMEKSLHALEVVNRLTQSADLPSEFLNFFISNCIQSCDNMPDKYIQNRLARLVCVLLQSLIRNKIINIEEIKLEVETFCLDFARIREATALYRLLKSTLPAHEGANHPKNP